MDSIYRKILWETSGYGKIYKKNRGGILDKIQPDIERIVIADVCETMLQLLA